MVPLILIPAFNATYATAEMLFSAWLSGSAFKRNNFPGEIVTLSDAAQLEKRDTLSFFFARLRALPLISGSGNRGKHLEKVLAC